jgi:uncharacterized protein YbjT (DUF2867 family)
MPAAVELVTGDLADPASLVAAMAGTEKVSLLSSPHPDAVVWNRNAIDAARTAGVGLLVRSSIVGADKESPAEFINSHTICDAYLQQSGLDHVIVRPNLFMQNIPESTLPSIDAAGNFYVDAGDARISMVDTRDVAAVVAVALVQQLCNLERLEGKEFLLVVLPMKMRGGTGSPVRPVALVQRVAR